MGEYAEEMAVSQGSEESEEHQRLVGGVQYPNFPSGQLLQKIHKFVEVPPSKLSVLLRRKCLPPCHREDGRSCPCEHLQPFFQELSVEW